MNLKTIGNFVTSKVGRQVLTVQKHSPVLLFGAGIIGVAATAVLASRATLKLQAVLDEKNKDLSIAKELVHQNYSDEDRRRDIAVVYLRTASQVTRMYAPAIALGVISVAALTGSHIILTRRNVAITAAYAALDKGFRQYRERVVEALGMDKDKEFRYGLTDREVVEEDENGVFVTTVRDKAPHAASVYARFFDENSTSWSKQHSYNQIFLQCQQNYANDLLRARGHVFLNEVYDMLGIPRSREGAVVGWVLGNGDDFIDFGVFEGDRHSGMRFVLGHERSILLDFNVDGIIYDKI